MPLMLVFGSLRKHSKRGFNFNRYGGQKFLRSFRLPGYLMRSFRHYPAIVRGEENDEITVELHEVEEKAYNAIVRMELGAGYLPVEVDIPEGKATIFVWRTPHTIEEYPLVTTGDWN
jgi:gamma-glutamylcyclotransferase (GGCT)/AIG2-like uncharacterized protein YtfP